MLKDALGDQRAGEVLAKIRARRLLERPFLELERANPYALGNALAAESPAVAALVMAHLAPAFSAACLGAFEQEVALNVVKRMATLKPPPFATLRAIAERIAAAVKDSGSGPGPVDAKARLKTVAELLSNAAPDMEKGVLEAIQEDDAEMANEIREFLFTWEDIGSIDKRSMQKILGAVDTKTLALALKGASEPVEENVMNNLSQRVRDMVREEREMIGAVPLSEVLGGRNEIMRSVRLLIESGEFRPTRGGEELVA
jgi:flagellar motor switch protein FliG